MMSGKEIFFIFACLYQGLAYQQSDRTKLVVATGTYGYENVEVVDLSGAGLTCQDLPDYPKTPIYGSSGEYSEIADSIILCGGQTSNDFNTECFKLNSGAKSWELFGLMNEGRRYMDSFITTSGNIALTGGANNPPLAIASSYVLDPLSASFTIGPSLQRGREGHCSVRVSDFEVWTIGGYIYGDTFSANVEIYDSILDESRYGPSLNIGRSGHSCAYLESGITRKIIVAGGTVKSGFFSEITNSVEIFDFATNTWTTGPNLPEALDSSAATTTPDNQRFLVVSGSLDLSSVSNSIYEYSLVTNAWSQLGQLKTGRSEAVATLVPDSFVQCQ